MVGHPSRLSRKGQAIPRFVGMSYPDTTNYVFESAMVSAAKAGGFLEHPGAKPDGDPFPGRGEPQESSEL